jgi:PAS domain S-box-containing protein
MPEASDKPGESAAAGQSVPRPDSNGEDRTGQRDNAERLRAIVDTAVDGIITIDSAGIVETMNPAAERLFGYSAGEVIGQNISMLMPSPYREEHNGYLKHYLSSGIRKIIGIGREVVGQRKDGSMFPMELSVSEMQLGERRMFTGIVRDISERRAAEEKLRRLAALLDDSSDAIKVLDLEGNIREWNPGAERMYGYSAAQALKMNVRELLPADRQSEILDAIARHRRGERLVPHETQRVTRDGRLVDVLCTMTILEARPGSEAAVVITDRNITERKRSEAALRDSEARGRAIVETAVDGIITISAEGIIESVNSAAERTFGYQAKQMVGQNVKMLMPEPFASEHDGYLRRYGLTGIKKIIGVGREVVGKRQDGTTFPMELSISEVKVGERRMFTGIVRDISERKWIEHDLVTYARTVEFNNSVLKENQATVEAAAEAKSTFLAHMSHEIRTPMTAILGFAELLLRDKESEQSPEWRRSTLGAIIHNGEHLVALINDILDLSKIEAGKMTVEERPTEVAELVRDVAHMMQVRADAKKIVLRVEAETALPDRVLSDPTRLRQILINIVGNAIKFTNRGGVRIVCRHLPDAAVLQFDVIDTGRGLTQEQAAKLFQPFTQADSSTTREYGGSGLGLAISRRLAGLLGGEVTLESAKLNHGSTFRVSVNAKLAAGATIVPDPFNAERVRTSGQSRPETPSSDAFETKPLAGLKVLLAEDGADNQRLLSHILRRSGADVSIASNGRAAVSAAEEAVAQSRAFDVILMDMQMPIMDGYEATGALRRAGYRGPIVALTAHAMAGEQERCFAVGCTSYLTKPISMDKLVKGVLDAMPRRGCPVMRLKG